jgi:hypothetical protein
MSTLIITEGALIKKRDFLFFIQIFVSIIENTIFSKINLSL